jgi:hypothetical protein
VYRILIASSVLMLAMTAANAQQHMQPGLWEFANTMTTPNAPKPQTATIKRCITEKEVKNPALLQAKAGKDCKVTPKGKTGEAYAWQMECPKSGMKGSGTMRYGKDTVEGETKMTASSKGQPIEVTTKTKGRRLGPCK